MKANVLFLTTNIEKVFSQCLICKLYAEKQKKGCDECDKMIEEPSNFERKPEMFTHDEFEPACTSLW